jgi:AraC-like DNA-binding protein
MPASRLTGDLDQALLRLSYREPKTLGYFGGAVGQPALRTGAMRGLHPGGLHQHACVELCFAAAGQSRMWRAEGYASLRPGQWLVIPPNTLHCEGWAQAGRSYRLLWLAVIGDAVHAFGDHYDPANGWQMDAAFFTEAAGGLLLSRAVAENDQSLSAHCRLQAALLLVLAALRDAALRPATTDGGDRQERLTTQVKRYLDLHYPEALTVGSIAALFRLSPNYLNSLFSRREGRGIYEYLLERRLAAAHKLLRDDQLLVKEVAHQVGFRDPLHFSRRYHQHFGHPPSARRASAHASDRNAR